MRNFAFIYPDSFCDKEQGALDDAEEFAELILLLMNLMNRPERVAAGELVVVPAPSLSPSQPRQSLSLSSRDV